MSMWLGLRRSVNGLVAGMSESEAGRPGETPTLNHLLRIPPTNGPLQHPQEANTNGSFSNPSHPSVAALRAESGVPSPQPGGRSPLPPSPANRHSPVSPAPITAPFPTVSSAPAQPPTSAAPFQPGQPGPYPQYPGGQPFPPQQQPPQYGYPGGFDPNQPQGHPPQYPPQYYQQGQPPGAPPGPPFYQGYPPRGFYPGAPPYGAGPPGVYPGHPQQGYPGPPGQAPPQVYQQPPQGAPRLPMTNGPSSQQSSDPATSPRRTPNPKPSNGPSNSLPSTPGTQSPGAASIGDGEGSNQGSTTGQPWPSPVRGMGPPQSFPPGRPLVASPAATISSRDSQSVVERLTNWHAYDAVTAQSRLAFYQRLLAFSEQKGTNTITNHPTVSKQPVDLHDLYKAVQERGGFEMVTKKKGPEPGGWRDLCEKFQISSSNSAAGQLKRQYDKYLFDYECVNERGNIDPEPIRKALEPKKKKRRPAPSGSPLDSPMTPGPPPGALPGAWPGNPPPGAPQMPPFPPQMPIVPQPPPPQQQQPPYPQQPTPPQTLPHGMVPGQPRVTPPSPQPPPPVSSAPPPQQPTPPATGATTPTPPARPTPTPGNGEVVARDPFDEPTPVSRPPPQSQSQPLPQPQQLPPQGYPGYPGSYRPYPPNPSLPASMPQYSGAQFTSAQNMPASTSYAPPYAYPQQPPPGAQYGGPRYPYAPQQPGAPQSQPQPPYPASSQESSSASTPPYVHPSSQPSFSAQPNSQPQPYPYQTASQPQPFQSQSVPPIRYAPPVNSMNNHSQYPGPSHHIPGKVPGPSSIGPKPVMPQRILAPGRRDTFFPPGSIESTSVTNRKRRKVTHRDLGKIDAWRLVMGLRSGLSAEVAWSLNILNILLYDDACTALFQLKSLPGLLEVLVEHLRRALVQIFPDEDFATLEDYWIDQASSKSGASSRDESPASIDTANRPIIVVEADKDEANPNKVVVETGRRDYSRVTRSGRTVRFRRIPAPRKTRHRLPGCGVEVTREAWEEGGGLTTDHLNIKFRPETLESLHFFSRPSTSHSKAPKKEMVSVKEEPMEGEEKTSVPPFFFRDFEPDSHSWELSSGEIGAPLSSALTDRSEWKQRASDLVLAISNVLRGLVVIPGNEAEMGRHAGLLMLIGRCLSLKHKHLAPRAKFSRAHSPITDDSKAIEKTETPRAIDVEDTDAVCESWRFETACQLREDSFVILCQLSVQLDLCSHEESVVMPIVDSLLHWVTCQSAEAKDPLLPGYLSPLRYRLNLCSHEESVVMPIVDSLLHWVTCQSAEAKDPLLPGYLSPLRYSLEALCKLSVLERNVDLILSTPPWARTTKLLSVLSGMLNMGEDVPVREFSLVIISALCSASDAVCILTAQETGAIGDLVGFLEAADGLMHQVVGQSGMGALRENPELMGTSVGMLRRAASVLACLAKVPGCRGRFVRHQQRLLQFTMSQLMDSRVAAIVSDSLWQLQQPAPQNTYQPPKRDDSPLPMESSSVKSEASSEASVEAAAETSPTLNGDSNPTHRLNGDCGKAVPPLFAPSSEKVSV